MTMLHIHDASDRMLSFVSRQRGEGRHVLGLRANELSGALQDLAQSGLSFSSIVFMTHGSPGTIWFGNSFIGARWWAAERGSQLHRLARPGARIYFNGCNVADGDDGWAFLEAAAAVFLCHGGGEVFGQTSLGFANPLSGHVVHLWGRTRRVRIDPVTGAAARSDS